MVEGEGEGFNKFKRKNAKPRNSAKKVNNNEDQKYGWTLINNIFSYLIYSCRAGDINQIDTEKATGELENTNNQEKEDLDKTSHHKIEELEEENMILKNELEITKAQLREAEGVISN